MLKTAVYIQMKLRPYGGIEMCIIIIIIIIIIIVIIIIIIIINRDI